VPYNAEAIHITWQFSIDSEREVAVTGLRVTAGPSVDLTSTLGAMDGTVMAALGTAYANLMSDAHPDLLWADYSRLTSVKAAHLNVSGHYVSDPKIHTIASTVGGDPNVNIQCTGVLSLRSVDNLGRGNRGRMYLPHTKLAQPAGGPRSNSSHTNNVAAIGADFIRTVNAIFNTLPNHCLVGIMSKVGAGSSKAVTRVEVGDVTDTQRERYEQLHPVYSTQPV
jgi:hypothetical protein